MSRYLFQPGFLTAAAICLFIVCGCGRQVPLVTPELIAVAARRDATTTPTTLETGRSLYLNRCASCHVLYAADAYSDNEWRSWVHRMAPKAHLDRQQESSVLNFLLAARDVSGDAEDANKRMR